MASAGSGAGSARLAMIWFWAIGGSSWICGMRGARATGAEAGAAGRGGTNGPAWCWGTDSACGAAGAGTKGAAARGWAWVSTTSSRIREAASMAASTEGSTGAGAATGVTGM
ncbi:hypothetical protein MTDSW087_02633 [Methylobacterium dankookense]|uniref:Uncharacterized protein n=1 Tax=Methylobacterium dankookense TaxID=560405 RepID=A0A564FYX4_9HYPH|nr:hypothetical protein MTDSW087_02633 [Methylobacterium dankookense]